MRDPRALRIGLIVAMSSFGLPTLDAQTDLNWTQKSPQTMPSLRSQAAMAFDPVHAQTVLFGGLDDTRFFDYDDTWVWDGVNWTKMITQTRPPARFGAVMVYDAARAQVILFGGNMTVPTGAFGSYVELNDTWVWDGVNWTQKLPLNSPPKREAPAMAYDAARRQVVLFGGAQISNTSCTGLANDTWVWDGANWTQKTTDIGPSGRFGSAMVYDAAHGQVVMFGGAVMRCAGSNATLTNETWIWDGTSWTRKMLQTSPPARYFHAMAYNSVHNQTVMFGGNYTFPAVSQFQDTWLWDGSNWTKPIPQLSPAPRFWHAMAYDSSRGEVVLFGGAYSQGDFSDTWTWDSGGTGLLPPPPTGPTITNIISAGAFGAFSTAAPGSWIEIYGSNLAATTRSWAGTDFNGNIAPSQIDGVNVIIGGQKAVIDYVAANPGQVNAQVPSNLGPGNFQVTVTNANVASTPMNLTVNTTQPGWLAPSTFKLGANQYVVAQLLDGTYILPAGAIAGVNSRPARPGDTIVIYGIGFGPVIPNLPLGQIVTQGNQISASFQVSFGQTVAQVPYSGLAPGFVGLYQFNIVVPAVADNNLVPITFKLAGVPSSQTLYIAVHQ